MTAHQNKCRNCGSSINSFLKFGHAPVSNLLLTEEQLRQPILYLPLSLIKCDQCHLVQISDFADEKQLFNDNYVYFSSTSSTFVEHARKYVEKMVEDYALNENSLVTEIASNDGYLLQWFKQKQSPCYGIEPTASTAEICRARGITVEEDFLTTPYAESLVEQYGKSNLIIANNVLAHVPDISDFLRSISELLHDDGIATLEFPHLLSLIKNLYYDTIYHEHFSYLSLITVEKIIKTLNLKIFKVEEIDTHGGSYRIYLSKINNSRRIDKSVKHYIELEHKFKLSDAYPYKLFSSEVEKSKNSIITFLLENRAKGRKVFGYGAASKASTLLNYCGIRDDLISCIIDEAPSKQGKYIPGANIPIVSPDILKNEKPDVFIIFAWNIRDELKSHILKYVNDVPVYVLLPRVECV